MGRHTIRDVLGCGAGWERYPFYQRAAKRLNRTRFTAWCGRAPNSSPRYFRSLTLNGGEEQLRGFLRMPMELVVGILLLSVLVNLALLVWVSRNDHMTLHWPRLLSRAANSVRPQTPRVAAPAVRRRALYGTDAATASPRPAPVVSRPGPAAPGAITSSDPNGALTAAVAAATRASRAGHIGRAPNASGAQATLSETLPPDLAQFLSQPATIAPDADGYGFTHTGDDGRAIRAASSGIGGPSIVARLPQPGTSAGSLGEAAAGGAMAIDQLTGLESPASWTRIIGIENARLMRYRRPMTVVMAEVDGLRRLAERMGQDPVDRLLPVIADAFAREARTSDWVARVGEGRFGALLAETDEIQAINYVERIRLVCEPWLHSSAVPLRLAIGWSSPTSSTDLEYAIRRAEERMHEDRRMPGKSLQPARAVAPRVVSLTPDEAQGGDGRSGSGSVPPAETGRVAQWGSAPPRAAEDTPVADEELTRNRGRRRAKSGTGDDDPSEH